MDENRLDNLLYYGGIGSGAAGIILLCVNLIAKPKGNLYLGTGLVCMILLPSAANYQNAEKPGKIMWGARRSPPQNFSAFIDKSTGM